MRIVIILGILVGLGALIFLSTQFSDVGRYISNVTVTPTVANITTYTANSTVIQGQGELQGVIVSNMAGWGLFIVAGAYLIFTGIKALKGNEELE